MSDNNECCYDKDTIINLRILYVVSIFLWIIIATACGITRKLTIVSMAIILFPISLMLLSVANLHKITTPVEKFNSQANYISLGLIVAVPLLSWIKTQKDSEQRNYEQNSMMLFVLLIMVTPMDVWVSEKDQAYVIHIKSICQVCVLALLSSMLLKYFSGHVSVK